MEDAWALGDGNLAAVLGTDPPNVLKQAFGVYERSLKATRAEERELERQKSEGERRARQAMNKAKGRG